MNGLENDMQPVPRKSEGFDEHLEIADFDIFEKGLDQWMQHAYAMLRELPAERMPGDFEIYLHRLEAYLERCDTELRECEALFEGERFKAISAALSEIRLKILAREIDPKFEREFTEIRKQILEPK